MIAGPVLLVGCGKMGGAMARGWLERGLDRLVIVEPGGRGDLPQHPGLLVVDSADAIPIGFKPAIVVAAVKPQNMDAVLPAYRPVTDAGACLLSIAAGKTIAYFQGRLGADCAVVRAMPNLPASIGRGITVAVANERVTAAVREDATALLAACGEVAWVEDEALIDPVTAVSGSGPAYVFLLVEALAAAGERAGLPAELAMRLARATISGAGELVLQSSETAATLRVNVTSPGGTTAAALQVLMAEDGLARLMDQAVAAASRRSRELAS